MNLNENWIGFTQETDKLKKNQIQLAEKIQKRNSILIKILRALRILNTDDLDKEILELKEEQKRLLGILNEGLSKVDAIINEIKRINLNEDIILEDKIQQLISAVNSFQEPIKYLIRVGFNECELNASELSLKSNSLVECKKILEDHNKKVIENQRKSEINNQLTGIEKRIDEILESKTYLVFPKEQQLLTDITTAQKHLSYIEDIDFKNEKESTISKYLNTISSYNPNFINERKKRYADLFQKGKDYSLDEEQKEAIIKDDFFNLVVAGAGSGKTETLITRIRYLVKREPDTVAQERILALAYTNASKEEIIERLKRHGIFNVEVKNFHMLGNAILFEAKKKLRSAGDNKPMEWIRNIINSKKDTDPAFRKAFLNYIKSFGDDKKIIESKKIQHFNQIKNEYYIAINDMRVKSRAEKEILDFLLTNKINGKNVSIEYEPIIKAPLYYSNGESVESFEPDVRITDYDLIIEHFALDQEGNVLNNFKGTDREWPEEEVVRYRENMQIKKKWFADNEKLVVYTYGNEYNPNFPDDFIEILKGRIVSKLKVKYNQDFEFNPMPYDEIIKVVFRHYDDPIPINIKNFITNAKVYGMEPEGVQRRLNENEKWSPKQVAFGELALIVYREYQKTLIENERNDFEDMINKPIQELRQDKTLFQNKYDQILIDEYQDISKQRFDLVHELLSRNQNCKLFCVGDDWQSIMGFAGADLDYFVNFEKYCRTKPCESKIQTNYRSIESIVETGEEIINNNKYKRPKNTHAKKSEQRKIEIIVFYRNETGYLKKSVENCVNRINYMIKKGYSPNDFMILSRIKEPIFNYFYDEFARQSNMNNLDIKLSTNGSAKDAVRLLTVHGSKGLEANVVFIMNVIDDLFGFPCRVQDPIILEPAKIKRLEYDPIEEERRLFYVAVTRAREDVIIYTHKDFKSQFLDEIQKHVSEVPVYETIGTRPSKQYENRHISKDDFTYM